MSVDAIVGTLAGLAKSSAAGRRAYALHGHFANVIEIGGARIAIAADGVGTKILLATEPADFAGIAIDCVAMNANDLICVGARPVAIVDYLAIESADGMAPITKAIAEGFTEAERQGCGGIVGGEVAVLAEIIAPRPDGVPAIDLAATAIGLVEGEVLDGSHVQPGDAVIGVGSSGIHSNGFTRVRRLVAELGCDLDARPPWPGTQPGETLRGALLEPTKLYPNLVAEPTIAQHLHAAANITGGGITNMARVLGRLGIQIDSWPELTPMFEWIATHLDAVEAFETFNMGVGFVIIVDSGAVDDVLGALPGQYRAEQIGVVVDDVDAATIEFDWRGHALVADRKTLRQTSG